MKPSHSFECEELEAGHGFNLTKLTRKITWFGFFLRDVFIVELSC